MGFYTGRSGSIIFNSKPVAKVRDWALDTTVELLSTNTLGSFSNTFTPGMKGASGSATLLYYRLESSEVNEFTSFVALLSKIHRVGAITESEAKIRLTLSAGDDIKDKIICDAYITSASISSSTGELVAVPIQFTVDGDFITGGTIS